VVPAPYNNFRKGRLAGRLRVVGVARRDWDTNQFRDRLRDGARQHSAAFDERSWEPFAREVNCVCGNLEVSGDYRRRQTYLSHQEGVPADRLYDLATAPDVYGAAGIA
jgi:glucose-6-phosphate 1-dehydrogenase